ncbi:hypothetical protein CTI12_AA390650 [Artemisia annua]|uniref:Uncharacterized protein n=1 Tax=Artemisia annua TaxID=35608 RepID=A0A2U1MEN0_ARTAN|nr:hypothetical protein CTI12_AA390650 [Artemisia annua]
MEHITKESVLLLNNGSVTFEDARALFNVLICLCAVDLSTFKARLEQLNIFVWKEVNGALVRIHGGDYELKILVRGLGRCYVVKGTKSFEDVIRMLEKQLKLSPGCYKLTYKHPIRSVGNVWVKTDRDWHFAVLISMLRGYYVLLNLEAADEDACDEDACYEDAYYEDACDENDLTDDDFYVEDFDEDDYVEPVFVEDPFDEDACDDVSANSMEHITKESILSLNNGSVTFEKARALFNGKFLIDLSTFKARLEQLDIFVWKQVNGALGLRFSVHGTKPFEDVIRMLEEDLNLSPGCYKLTYKYPNRSVGNVWVKTDRDWHSAVLLSKRRGYFVLLYLEVFASSQTADEDACDEPVK